VIPPCPALNRVFRHREAAIFPGTACSTWRFAPGRPLTWPRRKERIDDANRFKVLVVVLPKNRVPAAPLCPASVFGHETPAYSLSASTPNYSFFRGAGPPRACRAPTPFVNKLSSRARPTIYGKGSFFVVRTFQTRLRYQGIEPPGLFPLSARSFPDPCLKLSSQTFWSGFRAGVGPALGKVFLPPAFCTCRPTTGLKSMRATCHSLFCPLSVVGTRHANKCNSAPR